MSGLELALSVLLATSAAADVHSTIRIPNRVELNPVMRPFSRNAGALSGAVGGVTVGVVWGSHALRREGKKWWWVPLVAGTVVHGVAVNHNWRQR